MMMLGIMDEASLVDDPNLSPYEELFVRKICSQII